MNVRKFFGNNTREALKEVRDALGADALILSNRRVNGGVEIMAIADEDVDAITYDSRAAIHGDVRHTQTAPAKGVSREAPPSIQPETIAAILHRRQAVGSPGPTQIARVPSFEVLREPMMQGATIKPSTPAPQAAATPAPQVKVAEPPIKPTVEQAEPLPDLASSVAAEKPAAVKPSTVTMADPLVQEMALEMKRMRSLLEGQLSGFAWGEMARRDPLKAELMRTMLSCGFSPMLSRKLVEALPKGLDMDKGMKWIKAALQHNLRVVDAGADLISRGGIIALVGPTGVGKTTTVAKLAAKAVLKYGTKRVALITTDSYRIGAHEQLKIYGRILNVPVHAVKDEAELQLTLADLQRSHLVLIDTVGMSQRDKRISEQIEFLCGKGSRVRRYLLLPATAQNITLDDILRAYRGTGMEGVILSKLDESPAIAPAIDCMIRHGLDLHYVTNGQRVPEDLHMGNGLYLIDRAFKPSGDQSAHQIQEEEWSLAASNVSLYSASKDGDVLV